MARSWWRERRRTVSNLLNDDDLRAWAKQVRRAMFDASRPVWYEGTETVTVVATGLSTTSCDWVLTLPEGMTTPRSTALIRRRCAHLMAGGTIESYVEGT